MEKKILLGTSGIRQFRDPVWQKQDFSTGTVDYDDGSYLTWDTRLMDAHLRIYEAIRQAVAEFKMSPARTELRSLLGYSARYIEMCSAELAHMGYIESVFRKPRSMRPADMRRHLAKTEPPPWDRKNPPQYPQLWNLEVEDL